MTLLDHWKLKANQLRRETYALYLAFSDPRVPWYARWFVAAVVAYAFSPIDLIPDFIPVLGYLDDLVLVPAGIALALKMVPETIMDECRQEAREVMAKGKPTNWVAAGVITVIWVLCIALVVVALGRLVKFA